MKTKLFKEFQILRTNALTDMFENQDKSGLYPTTIFFNEIDRLTQSYADQALAEALRERDDQIKDWVENNCYRRFHTLEDSEEFLNFLRTPSPFMK